MHMHHDLGTILRLMCDLIVSMYKLISGNLMSIISSTVAMLIMVLFNGTTLTASGITQKTIIPMRENNNNNVYNKCIIGTRENYRLSIVK